VTYLLDTNTCIRYLNGRSPQIKKRLEARVSFTLVAAPNGRDYTWRTLSSRSVLPSLAGWAGAAVL